jgi:glycine/D-amino acid oxidase-like deaminating enzyme
MIKNVDAIIVGQGISGSLLSAEFIKNNKKVLVIDEEKATTSSKVAAGLYNPIVFKRVVKSWLIDELLPVMNDAYEYMEVCCNTKFHTPRHIVKVFVNEEEKLQWLAKAQQPGFSYYLNQQIAEHNFNDCINPHHGLARVNGAGNVDVKSLLASWADYLKTNESYLKDAFDYSDIALTNDGVKWKNYKSNFLIFCEGYKAVDNPFFNNLPFVPAKGELLKVKIDDLNTGNQVLNKGVFVLPLHDGLFRVGATYVWDKIDEQSTAEGRQEIMQKLSKLVKTNIDIIDQQAGIRPSTKDRRPFVGNHPNIPQLAILNGMGTKAVLLAPYFAKQLFEHLYQGKAIHPEADINRI